MVGAWPIPVPKNSAAASCRLSGAKIPAPNGRCGGFCTVSAQFMADDTIAMFELHFDGDEVSIVREKHYRLTEAKEIGEKDLDAYRMPEPD